MLTMEICYLTACSVSFRPQSEDIFFNILAEFTAVANMYDFMNTEFFYRC